MGSLECSNCDSRTAKKLIVKDKKMYCNECYESVYNRSTDFGLKSGPWGNMSKGKAWEIDQRTVSPDDGKTIINKRTGKPTQY